MKAKELIALLDKVNPETDLYSAPSGMPEGIPLEMFGYVTGMGSVNGVDGLVIRWRHVY